LSTADMQKLKTTLALCQIVSQLGSPNTNNMLVTLSYFYIRRMPSYTYSNIY